MTKILSAVLCALVLLIVLLGATATVLYFNDGDVVQGVGTSFSTSVFVFLLFLTAVGTVKEFKK